MEKIIVHVKPIDRKESDVYGMVFRCSITPKIKLILPNDAPLKYIDIREHDFSKGCLDAFHRIIERNGGVIFGESEEPIEDEDIISDIILNTHEKN